ncbi:hypothetical protein GCM10023340_03280 [Nocardioides marinquilinus]|uniref:mannan endo-1,4-beta-mannosidase n=1 Tax=Nocardioides marinquilinus TaxID=1210400 RepID=A0ABP9P6E9_9ACTN
MAEGPRRLATTVTSALVAAVVGLLGGLVGCSPPTEAFVTRSGTTLQVDGAPFRFVGFNLYDAAASDLYSCSPSTRLDDAALDEAMRSVADAGGTVVRFWVFQPYTAGGTDFSGVDRVLDAARAHGLRVLPVLEDGQGNCSTGEPAVPLRMAGVDWYSEGYRVPYGTATVSYRDYAATVARHYRDDPTIIGWSLLNEGETYARTADGRSVLVGFARDMAAVVRAADPHHLVTVGTQSNGAPGTSGADFRDVYGVDGVDFAEVHDWGFYGSDDEAMPGADADGTLPDPDDCDALDAEIGCSFAIAQQLGLPIVVGEAGLDPAKVGGEERRAGLFRGKIAAAFAAGASGYLLWQLNVQDTDGYGVLVGSDDPVFAVLADAAAGLHATAAGRGTGRRAVRRRRRVSGPGARPRSTAARPAGAARAAGWAGRPRSRAAR